MRDMLFLLARSLRSLESSEVSERDFLFGLVS